MRMRALAGLGMMFGLIGCAGAAATPAAKGPAKSVIEPAATDSTPVAIDAADAKEPADTRRNTTSWIGASGEGEMLMSGTRDTVLGVWVDVPEARPEKRPPLELALVIDTSGSMAGAKIANARSAATTLVENLKDGDIVALDTFSDTAKTVVPATRLTRQTRSEILRAIATLGVEGSTNMFDGLSLAEAQLAGAPPTHPLRRVVVISDGIANVGPSSPEVLGAIAERGLAFRTQVTSLGVGTDYDERTLNALAVRSSGRLYHLTEAREMASILRGELDLINATLASDATVEVVPAPGVSVLGADGVRADFRSGMLSIPLGALHAGQHREALVRVRVTDPAAFQGQPHALASVRLRFRDAQEDDLERVQEVVARTQFTGDSAAVASHVSSRTKAIAAIQEMARVQMTAAQQLNEGHFGDADKELAKAQRDLAAQAQVVTAPAEKKRLAEAERKVAAARATAQAAPSKPKMLQRDDALKMNASGMAAYGY